MELLGGQAVIEGVMMKGKTHIAIAVRKKGKIVTKKDRFVSITKKYKPLGWPFIRGIVNLFEMMVVGVKALDWSANQALDEAEEEEFSGWHLAVSIILAFAFALFLFKFIPLGLTTLLHKNNFIGSSRLLFNLIDGAIRIGIFTLYIYLISLWNDMHRLFQYHGAEHKAVLCYEAKKPLTVKNVQKFSTLHPRCGTSFIIFVFLIAILVFSLISVEMNFALLFFFRFLLVFPIAGIAYELLRYSALMRSKAFFKLIITPGLAFQRLTTKEPTNKQVEVSIASLKLIL
ncbi:MAG: DUF1385 domain-containing protein [Candidatus Woesearchaeota archaeon]|jgi:uncharacterized protein YqhQ|nr:DUF1385 domain-containing protein [Candidatus Woesearchaeota archaeon]MDP7180829.1 DUF1385 domain-containing protein [Candidatus Woesearchaeota archaeon]MDP7457231.1 DUF1385 domain-containing protein [Candidatus Woesearchaeota archaeon]